MKRRQFILSASAAVGAAAGPFFHIRPAKADSGELVIVSWGGDYDDALRQFVCEPYQKQTGVRVRVDTPPENAKVKAMVESGNVIWDVLLTDVPAVSLLSSSNLLEPMDYDALDKKLVAAIPKELQLKNAIGQRIFSWNIVYNTNALPKAKHPESWADVWDGKKFAGGRSFNFSGGTSPQLEIALLADGVPMDKLYPLDVERAWRSMDKLRPLVAKWFVSHAEAIQLLANGEVAIASTVGARGISAKHNGAPIDVEYSQGKLGSDNWCVVKGSRNKKAALDFINFALDGQRQAEIAKKVPYGPSSANAFGFLSPQEAADLCTAPDNIKRQFWWNVDWWGTPGPDGKIPRESQAARYATWMAKG